MRIASSYTDRMAGVTLLHDLHRMSAQIEAERLEGASEVDCAYVQAFIELKIIALGRDGMYARYDA